MVYELGFLKISSTQKQTNCILVSKIFFCKKDKFIYIFKLSSTFFLPRVTLRKLDLSPVRGFLGSHLASTISQSSWRVFPESVFMALGSASVLVPALALCPEESQTQLLLWLSYAPPSLPGSKRVDISRSPVA